MVPSGDGDRLDDAHKRRAGRGSGCDCYFATGSPCKSCRLAQEAWYGVVTEQNWRDSRMMARPYKLPRPRPKVSA